MKKEEEMKSQEEVNKRLRADNKRLRGNVAHFKREAGAMPSSNSQDSREASRKASDSRKCSPTVASTLVRDTKRPENTTRSSRSRSRKEPKAVASGPARTRNSRNPLPDHHRTRSSRTKIPPMGLPPGLVARHPDRKPSSQRSPPRKRSSKESRSKSGPENNIVIDDSSDDEEE